MLCPTCKRLMKPDRATKKWVCPHCGVGGKLGSGAMVGTQEATGKSVTVLGDRPQTNPIAQEECPKCGNDKAYWVLRQTRGADEPETRIFECTKCGNKWREYQ